MEASQIDYSQIIIETLNKLFSGLFSSIDNSIYSMLDHITFISENIFEDKLLKSILNPFSGIIIIANSLLVGFVIYYCFRLMLSYYSGNGIEKPNQFLVKAIICAICINYSLFFCTEIIKINNLISDSFCQLGYNICKKEISFNTLILETNNFINLENNFNIFSFNGLLKSSISIGMINLLFSYSIRYILIKILILLSPFAILSLIMQETSWVFKIWLRTFISLLLLQSFVALILLIIFMINISVTDILSQISYISALFILSKANSYIKEIFGGVSTDFNTNISSIKSLLK